MKNYIVCGLALLFLMVSCKSQKENTVVEEKQVIDPLTEEEKVKFSLDEIAGAYIITSIEEIPEMEGVIPTLVIGSDGKLKGMNGCNSFFGSVTTESGQGLFGNIGSTRKMCDGIANEIENRFMSYLKEVDNAVNNGEGGLNFMVGERTVIKAKKATLEGQWKLLTFNGKNEAKRDIRFTIVETQLEGNGGCNVFNGQLEQNNFDIEFTEMRSTEMACEGVDMTFETSLIHSFDKVTSFRVENGFTAFYYNQEVLFTAKQEE